MSNILDSIQLSGTVYTLSAQTSGGGGNPTVELTQAEYDALVSAGTVSANTYYIITDAQAGDLTQYWTSAQTNSAITEATSGKVDTSSVVSSVTSASTDSEIPTAKAVYDAIPTGGSTTYTAGRGIDITNDTISFSLPISAGTGANTLLFQGGTQSSNAQRAVAFGQGIIKSTAHNSAAFGNSYAEAQNAFAEGSYCHASGNTSHAEGSQTTAYTQASHTEGNLTEAKNFAEHASGSYNNSVSASTTFGDSGNTLFSVGNGTANNARHNAFEIRQNGDIYLNDGSKLQDTVSATTANTTALGGLKLVKLTQSAYDALSPDYDSSTLYVIVN